jgi:hypothetical protein
MARLAAVILGLVLTVVVVQAARNADRVTSLPNVVRKPLFFFFLLENSLLHVSSLHSLFTDLDHNISMDIY